MLIARGHGLHACAQEAWTYLHKTLATFLPLPSAQILFCGMALGHADETAPINSWRRSPRETVDKFATFSGFAT
jgi:nitroreductase